MSEFFATLWTVARLAPLSMEFSRQEYWSGLPFPSPGNLPKPGIEPGLPALQADSLPAEPPGKPFNQFTFKVIIYMYDPIIIFLIVLGLFSLVMAFLFLMLPAYRSSFSICCKAVLVVLNSLNFCLSEKLLVFPSNLNKSLSG